MLNVCKSKADIIDLAHINNNILMESEAKTTDT